MSATSVDQIVDGPTEQLLTGFTFLEGPVWEKSNQELWFSDITGNTTYRWNETNGLRVLRNPSQNSNGNCLDPAGRFISCEHVTSTVVRTEPDGTFTTLASHFDGAELNSPNDVISASDGSVLFTDPPFGRMIPEMGPVRPRQLDIAGVYLAGSDPHSTVLLTDRLTFPNGLCLDAAEENLFVNDTATGEIVKFAIDRSDGRIALDGGTVWAVIPGDGVSAVDGMKFDGEGNLYCTGPGGVHVLDPSGTPLGVIQAPEPVANFNWGTADNKTLFMCATTSVYRVRVTIAGLL